MNSQKGEPSVAVFVKRLKLL